MRLLESVWWRRDEPAWAELLLWPLTIGSIAYRAGAALARPRPVKAAVPVISVGNIVVGGAGKTPVAMAIARRLIALGRTPAILSRGYGRRGREPIVVEPASSVADVGDEPLMMARRGLRVLVGPRRALLAQEAVKRGADVLVLDDGLQHRGLHRDLDVLVVDASNPLGNARRLPRGPMREGLQALERVGLVWLTRVDLARPDDPQIRAFGEPAVESAYAAAADLRGERVFLFAGIARPQPFEALVRSLGASVAGVRWFRDHHRFTERELDDLRRAGARLVTTEKDAARLPPGFPATALPVELRIVRGEEALGTALARALR